MEQERRPETLLWWVYCDTCGPITNAAPADGTQIDIRREHASDYPDHHVKVRSIDPSNPAIHG